jgi:hypothetical protein
LPIGYGALFSQARQFGAITESQYTTTLRAVIFFDWPGRTILAVTPYEGALRTTHLPFWRSLIALTAANTFGWMLVFLALTAIYKWVIGAQKL